MKLKSGNFIICAKLRQTTSDGTGFYKAPLMTSRSYISVLLILFGFTLLNWDDSPHPNIQDSDRYRFLKSKSILLMTNRGRGFYNPVIVHILIHIVILTFWIRAYSYIIEIQRVLVFACLLIRPFSVITLQQMMRSIVIHELCYEQCERTPPSFIHSHQTASGASYNTSSSNILPLHSCYLPCRVKG